MSILSLKKELHVKEVQYKKAWNQQTITWSLKQSALELKKLHSFCKNMQGLGCTAAFCPLRAMYTGYKQNKATHDYFEEGLKIY